MIFLTSGLYKMVGQYYVQMFDATLAGMVGQAPGVCIFGRTCGHAAAMEHNGDVYACDHFVFPEYRLGNIKTDTLVSMMLSERQIRLVTQSGICFLANVGNVLIWTFAMENVLKIGLFVHPMENRD